MTKFYSIPVVYFFQREDGLIKIGTTTDLKQRQATLETGAGPLKLLALVIGSYSSETTLHSMFAEDRVFGEWFNPSDGLLEFINKAVSRDL